MPGDWDVETRDYRTLEAVFIDKAKQFNCERQGVGPKAHGQSSFTSLVIDGVMFRGA